MVGGTVVEVSADRTDDAGDISGVVRAVIAAVWPAVGDLGCVFIGTVAVAGYDGVDHGCMVARTCQVRIGNEGTFGNWNYTN